MTPWFRAPRAALGLYAATAMRNGDSLWRDIEWDGAAGPALLSLAVPGGGAAGGMALSLLLVAGCAFAAYSLGSRLGGRGAGVAAAGALAAFLMAPRVFGGGGEPAVADACFSVIAAALVARGWKNPAMVLAAGIAAGIALLFRVDIVRPAGLLIGVGWLSVSVSSARSRAILFAAGCVAVPAAVWMWAARHGAGDEFLRSLGVSPAPPDWLAGMGALRSSEMVSIGLLAAPLWALPILDAVNRRGKITPAQKALFGWFAVELASVLWNGDRTLAALTALAGPLAFLAAAALDLRPPAVASQIRTPLLTILFLVPLFIMGADMMSPDLSLTHRSAVEREDAQLAATAARLSPAGERIYVWGATPLLYVEAKRLAAHRNVLPGPMRVVETLDDLQRRPPAALVVGGRLFSEREMLTPGFENSVMALLRRIIKERYLPVGTMGGTFVFRRADAAGK